MASVSRLLALLLCRMLAALGLVGCAAAAGLGDAFSALAVEKTVFFELGGVPSATLLRSWNSTTESYTLRGPGNRTRVRTVYFQPTAAPIVAGKPVDTGGCAVSPPTSPPTTPLHPTSSISAPLSAGPLHGGRVRVLRRATRRRPRGLRHPRRPHRHRGRRDLPQHRLQRHAAPLRCADAGRHAATRCQRQPDGLGPFWVWCVRRVRAQRLLAARGAYQQAAARPHQLPPRPRALSQRR